MNITKELASKLIVESAAFRQFILDEAFRTDPSSLVNRVMQICRDNPGNKIASIKAVRELSRDTMESEFTNAYGVSYYDGNVLGLADSKKIVEKYL